jgi:ATP-dependent Clp protease ATP-binding subunit ClpC
VREAEDAARELRHASIGPEHLLLGLLAVSQGIAAKSLTSMGVTREAVVAELERGEVEPARGRRRHVPFTPRAKQVLEGALAEALQLAHNYIGTEHILLGLFREPDAKAVTILDRLGVSRARVQADVMERLKKIS